MKKTVLFAALFAMGCSTHQSVLRSNPLGPVTTDGEAAAPKGPVEADCGWVVVDEVMKTKFLGLTLSSYVRQFNDALFYCCPGESKTPACQQADWTMRARPNEQTSEAE
jgi:hypothetical protein